MMRHKGKEKLRQAWDVLRGFFRTHAETMRSVVLAALVCLLIVQSVNLWTAVTNADAADSAPSTQSTETDSSAAAVPIRFAARSADGLYGLQYNADGLRTAYEDTADIWASALENAQTMTASDIGSYRRALKGELLLMEYDGSIPLYALAGWLGCTLPDSLADSTAGTLALTYDGEGYTLYLRDRRSGTLRSASTTVEDTAFLAAVGQYEANDCTLAAEEENSGGSPDLMYFSTAEVFDVVSFAAYDGSQGLSDLLTAFGLDAEAAQSNVYLSGDKSVYVTGENKVRLSADGMLRYEGTGLRVTAGAGTDRLVQCIQTGYELTGAVLEAIGSGASAMLTDAYTDSSGRYVTVYGIQLGGVPVDNAATGYFARCVFEGNVLTRADMALRTTQTTGETIAVMPEKQAATSMDSTVDAVLSLRYIDEAVGTDSTWNQLYETDSTEDTDTTGTTNGWQDNPDAAGENEDLPEDETNTTGTTGTTNTTDTTNTTETAADNTETFQSSWYDSKGTPVSPKWYVLRYGTEEDSPILGRTLTPEEIVVVQADFDRMIQGGGAS